jgi:hypothetical protein
MAILIKNPQTERKARDLARLRGQSLTAAIDGALARALAEIRPVRPSVADMLSATQSFRTSVGLDRRPVDASGAALHAPREDGLERDRES